MKLLHIVASPRGEKSRTLYLSNVFLNALKVTNPGIEIETLDLFKVNLPEVTGNAIDAKYALMSSGGLSEQSKSAWEAISKYSKDFLSYDAYLITNPMWNFSIPYKLKHYIDVIMQAGILFNFTESGVTGLAINKKMFCITSRGNDYGKESPMNQFDFQESYLRSIFGLAGIHEINFINAQPLDFAPGITEAMINKAIEEAQTLAKNF